MKLTELAECYLGGLAMAVVAAGLTLTLVSLAGAQAPPVGCTGTPPFTTLICRYGDLSALTAGAHVLKIPVTSSGGQTTTITINLLVNKLAVGSVTFDGKVVGFTLTDPIGVTAVGIAGATLDGAAFALTPAP